MFLVNDMSISLNRGPLIVLRAQVPDCPGALSKNTSPENAGWPNALAPPALSANYRRVDVIDIPVLLEDTDQVADLSVSQVCHRRLIGRSSSTI